jgi:3D (Asp-Asp-Asp) domain-containing protein
MKSLFGGSAAVAAALLASSFILSATPSAAETPLSPFQQQKQEPTQASRSDARGQSEAKDQAETRDRIVDPKAEIKREGDAAGASRPRIVTGVVPEASDPAGGLTTTGADSSVTPLTAPVTYMATAYSLGGRTASGQRPAKGLIAADPSVLPLGTRVRLDAGAYSGEYMVADTGGAVRGKRIDIWTPSSHEASRFGRRTVKLTVLSYPVKRKSPRRPRG